MALTRATIYWDTADFNQSAGSIRVSRSDTDELGSFYTILTGDSTQASLGSFVGSEVGSDNFAARYIIEFNEGGDWTGSSEPLVPIEYLLTDLRSVKKRARIGDSTDISDFEIYTAILDCTNEILSEYSNPIKRTYVIFESSTGSTTYDFTGTRKPVHRINELRVDSEAIPYHLGSWTPDYNRGLVKFPSGFISSNDGLNVELDWVPKQYSNLCRDMAAMRIIDGTIILDGEEVRNPLMTQLKASMESIKSDLMPRGLFRSTPYGNYDPLNAEFIYQRDWYP